MNFDRFLAKFKTDCYFAVKPISRKEEEEEDIFYDLWFC